jgi:ectoine hydroxylase-related dioxygenase (phytanoyl-CoA dioxygenase family)
MNRDAPPSAEEAEFLLQSRGWALFPQAISRDQVAPLCADCDAVYDLCRAVQTANGVASNMEGTAHHIVGYGGPLDGFLEAFPLYDEIEHYFGGKFVVLNYGAAVNPPNTKSYSYRPHRDVRAFTPGYRLSLNMLVLLADFTPENGGTLILSGSHHVESMPSPAIFERHAEQITGQAGDIVLFNSLVVHSAAPNRSDQRRRALTLCLGRPFMKPQMDWQRYLSPSFQAGMSPKVRQLLGFNARVAASLDEYYQPEERWTFRADQK